MGDCKYLNLSNLVLHLLSIPASSADCERVFSSMRCVKADLKSGLHPDAVSSLIGVHFISVFNCCKQSDFEPSFLDKAKLCTREKNISYKHSMTS